MEFDEFVKIPGCTKGVHSATAAAPSIAPSPNATPATASASSVTLSKDGVETYGPTSSGQATPTNVTTATSTPPAKPASPEKVDWAAKEECDPADAKIPKGSRCKRRGCGAVWDGEDGGIRAETEGWKKSHEGTDECGECRYHPGNPIFHEGSKGYLCCKRRVMDFDDFLNMPGCRYTTHLFVGQPKAETEEEKVDCRLDHYQTPSQVIVSAFAKGADKEKSKVAFETERVSRVFFVLLEFVIELIIYFFYDKVHLDLHLPARKRVIKTIELYGPIDPEQSKYKILGTKVEMTLQKPSPTSWSLLTKPAGGATLPAGYALTFGVSGRTGTVGGKEMVLEVGKRL
ncbi:hypothetical protein QFC19_000040 [Naganishia cerealis]|uniref:Uncharacterized protein n=1 Tax=Naganishia cerealis TaxID=610337 RepID=A0ACC2WS39_9TREE|nr:hypothetical protein QFC19_000040 [Naganishia cerealis]